MAQVQISQIQKEKKKKQNMLFGVLFGGAGYLYCVFVILHLFVIRREDPRIGIGDALNMAMANVFVHPLEAFKAGGNAFLYVFLFSLLAATAAILISFGKELRKHDNPETVKGQAKFMSKKEADEFCTEKANPIGSKEVSVEDNIIIAEDLFLSIDERQTHLVPNIVVSARAGAGKGQGLVDPNVLQNFSSQLITDPSGELYRRYAKYKENSGYVVNCLNLERLRDGSKYNPLAYIKEEKDVDILVQCLMDNLKEDDAGGGEQFWNDTAKLFIESLILYLWHCAAPEKQTFEYVLKLLHMASVDENDASAESPLDILFSKLEKEDPNNLAVKRYQDFKIGAGKTLKSILITVTSKLKKFELEDMQYMCSADEMDLTHFADTKHVLFVIVPTGDAGTFNFIASMLYTQLFQEIYRYGNNRVMYSAKAFLPDEGIFSVFQGRSDQELKMCMGEAKKYVKEVQQGLKITYNKTRKLYMLKTKKTGKVISWRGTKEEAQALAKKLEKGLRVERVQDMGSNKIPTPVQFILDEFKSTGKIPAFTDKISTVRKYGVSIIIILQSIAQLEIMYKEESSTIMSNCPIKILMGTSDSKTIKTFTETTGKKTTTVENTSYNANGGGSSSYSKDSQDLITPDMVARLDYKHFYVLIDGENPYYGCKFLVNKHPKAKLAESTRGMYFNKNQGKSKPLVPWRLRNKTSATVVKAAKDAEEGKKEHKTEPEAQTEEEKTENPVQNNETPPATDEMKAKNEARKKEAAEAREALHHFEENFGDTPEDMINMGIMESFGLAVDSSDEDIKEAVESTILLEPLPSDTFTFAMTN